MSQNSQKTPLSESPFNRIAGCFPLNLAKCLRTPLKTPEHLQAIASLDSIL